MKKIFAAVLLLAMTLCAAGAGAVNLPGGATITKAGGVAKQCTSNDVYSHDSDADYCMVEDGNKNQTLYILKSGLTISGLNTQAMDDPDEGINKNHNGKYNFAISVLSKDSEVTLTLDNVKITNVGISSGYEAVRRTNSGNLTLILKNGTQLSSSVRCVYVDMGSISVKGDGTQTTISSKSDQGIWAKGNCTVDSTPGGRLEVSGAYGAVYCGYNTLSLGGNVTLKSTNSNAVTNTAAERVTINGRRDLGITLEVSTDENGTEPAMPNGVVPYMEQTDITKHVIENGKTIKYIKTNYVTIVDAAAPAAPAADLPTTGDSSSLALWLALLSLAALGAMAMKRREA